MENSRKSVHMAPDPSLSLDTPCSSCQHRPVLIGCKSPLMEALHVVFRLVFVIVISFRIQVFAFFRLVPFGF
jgi:hypothetical protein